MKKVYLGLLFCTTALTLLAVKPVIPLEQDTQQTLVGVMLSLMLVLSILSIVNEKAGFISDWVTRVVLATYGMFVLVMLIWGALMAIYSQV